MSVVDLSYNLALQDWDFANGDFVITQDASAQNGGIILMSRAFASDNPIVGIGIYQIRNASDAQINYEMNRWKQQVFDDGGRASVTVIGVNGVNNFEWGVNYD